MNVQRMMVSVLVLMTAFFALAPIACGGDDDDDDNDDAADDDASDDDDDDDKTDDDDDDDSADDDDTTDDDDDDDTADDDTAADDDDDDDKSCGMDVLCKRLTAAGFYGSMDACEKYWTDRDPKWCNDYDAAYDCGCDCTETEDTDGGMEACMGECNNKHCY